MQFSDDFWDFASARYQMYENRQIAGVQVPSGDPILDNNRFTNTFRVTDRVSQRLLHVQQEGFQDEYSLVMRTLLFKVFNLEPTWDILDSEGLTVEWNPDAVKARLDTAPVPIFNGAYMMANRLMAGQVKHHFYIDLLDSILENYLPTLLGSKSLQDLTSRLVDIPGIGPFLGYQYAIDLNYTGMFGFSENDAVVAGHGAKRGLVKLFGNARLPEQKIRQLWEERERGPLLLGKREMHLIDVQNMLCEYDKYTRSRDSELGRRMKQRYRPDPRPLPDPIWPVGWNM